MKIATAILTLVFSISVFAQVEFPENIQYRRNIVKPELDSFCPRLEGIYPENCCPYKQRTPISCFYYQKKTVAIGVAKTQGNCVDNVFIQEECCDIGPIDCITDLTEKTFIQRLIKRYITGKNRCQFEACPFPNYWKGETVVGQYISRLRPTEEFCPVVQARDQCASTTMKRCTFSVTSCPVPVPSPDPVAAGPEPGTGGPGVDPGPSDPGPSDPGPVYPGPSDPGPAPLPGGPGPGPGPSPAPVVVPPALPPDNPDTGAS